MGLFGRPFARLMPRPAEEPDRRSTPARRHSVLGRPAAGDPGRGNAAAAGGAAGGCAQQVLRPEINEATVRVLTRHGCEVVIAKGAGCCGGILHQLGWEERTRAMAKANIDAWSPLLGELDAIVFNASGCGVSLQDYGHLLSDDAEWAEPARRVSALSKDVSEVLLELGAMPSLDRPTGQTVTYHAACTMQHGLGLRTAGQAAADGGRLHRARAGGTAHLLRLRRRLLDPAARAVAAAAGAQGGGHRSHGAGDRRHRQHRLHHPHRRRHPLPVVHTIELLDWATGGPKPAQLAAGSDGAAGR